MIRRNTMVAFLAGAFTAFAMTAAVAESIRILDIKRVCLYTPAGDVGFCN